MPGTAVRARRAAPDPSDDASGTRRGTRFADVAALVSSGAYLDDLLERAVDDPDAGDDQGLSSDSSVHRRS